MNKTHPKYDVTKNNKTFATYDTFFSLTLPLMRQISGGYNNEVIFQKKKICLCHMQTNSTDVCNFEGYTVPDLVTSSILGFLESLISNSPR